MATYAAELNTLCVVQIMLFSLVIRVSRFTERRGVNVNKVICFYQIAEIYIN